MHTPTGTETARSPHPGTGRLHRLRSGTAARTPGLALAVAIAVVATVIGRFVPLVGGPVSAIVIGVALAALIKPRDRLRPGTNTAGKFILQFSVVVLGSQLSLSQIAQVGLESLPVMLGTLMACLFAAYLLGRWLGIVRDLRTLIGVGTGICGASAIAAVT
ncbi:putative sulfate exporter family transporter, partial [Arthrobacter sp. UYEF21]|uniref:putative sulfate exporter family transporter n=1 Tax=Arthrobacter sp. UYEF21 TaxID=1756364 RepID=UPI0033943F94